MKVQIRNNLVHNKKIVGYRIGVLKSSRYFGFRVFDIARDEFELAVEDLDIEVERSEKDRKDIILRSQNGELVPINDVDMVERTYVGLMNSMGYLGFESTDLQLKGLYNRYNREIFDNELPKVVKVEWSSRLMSCAGICIRRRNKRTSENEFTIRLSEIYHNIYPEETILTLIHEMIHVKYPEEKHGHRFKSEMLRIRKKFDLDIQMYCKPFEVVKYIYECHSCGVVSKQSRKFDTSKYSCKRCKGKFFLVEELDEFKINTN